MSELKPNQIVCEKVCHGFACDCVLAQIDSLKSQLSACEKKLELTEIKLASKCEYHIEYGSDIDEYVEGQKKRIEALESSLATARKELGEYEALYKEYKESIRQALLPQRETEGKK